MALTPYISPYDVYVDRRFVRGGTVFFTEAQAGPGWRTPTAADYIQQGVNDAPFLSYPRDPLFPPVIPTVSLSIDQAQTEGNSGAKLFTYTVTRSLAIGSVGVVWSFSAGDTSASDFTGGVFPTGGTVNMADGVFTGTFAVSVNGDTDLESSETFTVSIAAPSGCILGAKNSATGTIINDDAGGASISSTDASGWSAQWASGTPPTFAPDTSPQTITLTRAGYSAAGAVLSNVSDTIVMTQRVRQPWPNDGSLTASTVALSDYVYSTDSISGVTNNSTEISPKPIANWVTPHRAVIGNTLAAGALEIVAAHRNARLGRGVACVIFRVTDGTTTISATVAATVVSGRTGDRNPVLVYRNPVMDITSLNAGVITCNAEVYPWVGGPASVAKSATDGNTDRGFSPRYFLKNVTLAGSPPFAYVSTTGNDGTGVVNIVAATAAATPFLTIKGAIDGIHNALSATTGIDGAIVRVGAGTFVWVAPTATRTQKLGYLTIERDPAVSKANAIISWGGTALRMRFGTGTLLSPVTSGCLRISDVTMLRTGTQAFGNASDPLLEVIFDNGVAFDNGSFANAYIANAADYHFGTTFTNAAVKSAFSPGTAQHRLWRGISIDLNGQKIENWLTVGSIITRPQAIDTGTTYAKDGLWFGYNLVQSPSTTTCMQIAGASYVGAAVVQNTFEYTAAVAGNDLWLSGDSDTASNSHVCLHNNTFTGAYQAGRWNAFYDEGPTPRISKLMSVIGNIAPAFYTKSDVFRGAAQANPEGFTSGSPSTRTGNWPFMYGVGCQGNFTISAANAQALGGNETVAYGGLGSKIGTSWNVPQDPLFTANAATTVSGGTSASPTYAAGAGGGTYTLQGGSPAKAIVTRAVQSHDFAGNARPTTADAAGAFA